MNSPKLLPPSVMAHVGPMYELIVNLEFREPGTAAATESSHYRRRRIEMKRFSELVCRGAGRACTTAALGVLLTLATGFWVDGKSQTVQTPQWLAQIKEIIPIETWRDPENTREAQVRANLEIIKNKFQGWIDDFVVDPGLTNHVPTFFEWKSDDDQHWVFGWRVGGGDRKITFLTHLDTVAPGDDDWDAFSPREEGRVYRGSETTFLVGRGAIDDKGPAVVTLNVLLQVLKEVDGDPSALDDITLELLLDTSEETDLSTRYYYEDNPRQKPTLGIVFDAMWCIRAEKGIERPLFSVAMTTPPTQGIWIDDFRTSAGSTNQIPDAATARIFGRTPDSLDEFAANVEQWYSQFEFDNPNYRSARLVVAREGDAVVLTTNVAGAQHGSAPHENREKGANPLVSLANFLAHLAETDVLEKNHFSQISDFIQWGWGTMVFGEKHPDLLYRYDPVFNESNGTTYALTQLVPNDAARRVTLAVDIRYAIGHHAHGWDGTEGQIPGDSLFESAFRQLVDRFERANGGTRVTVETNMLEAPDLRNPHNAFISAVNDAYREVSGQNCPMLAIGGGTDAKGNLELVAAGALFTDSLGPPVNFHGINEGAPIIDLENSAKILRRILETELDLN